MLLLPLAGVRYDNPATVKMTLEVHAQTVTPAKCDVQSKIAGMLKAGVVAK
jgi:hypothetical protein